VHALHAEARGFAGAEGDSLARLNVIDCHLNYEGLGLADDTAATEVVVLVRAALLQHSYLI